MFKNDPDKSIDMLASGGAAVLANDGAATGCVEVTEAGTSDANTSKPLDEKSDNRGYGNVSAGVGDEGHEGHEGLPDPEVYEAARRIDEERWAYRFAKRAFDIVFSILVILVLLVPSVILCIAISLESPGCPIYSQKRVGRIGQNGEARTFDMYKFRSMYADADERLSELAHMNEANGPLFKIKDDLRVTRIGRFIRKHSIDELPQFLNCLMGQIPSRILKTGQEELANSACLFALPAKEMRTKKALFPQVEATSGTSLRAVQNFFKNLTAHCAQSQSIFAKREFTPISWGQYV